jgi:hypothetical protein
LGNDSGYHLIARAFDGGNWQYTLQAADGSNQTVDASSVSPEVRDAPTPTAPFMDKVGIPQRTLITREAIGDIPAQSPVQLIKIIWYEGKPPVYLITPDLSSQQPIVVEANAAQLDYAGVS